MAKKKDDVYIAMLRAVRELSVAGKSVERDQVVDKIHAGYKEIDSGVIRRIWGHAVDKLQNSFYMRPDAYFQLMEYEELQEARQSSRRALEMAFLAFLVSAAIGITSIAIVVTL